MLGERIELPVDKCELLIQARPLHPSVDFRLVGEPHVQLDEVLEKQLVGILIFVVVRDVFLDVCQSAHLLEDVDEFFFHVHLG